MLISREASVETDSQISDQSSSSAYNEFEPSTVNSVPLSETYLSPQSLLKPASTPAPNSISTQSAHQRINPVTAATNKRASEEQLFCKRGSKMKKSSTLMEEAVDALKQFCQLDPAPPSETLSDSAHTLALFVESRLRSLSPEDQKQCEDEILKLLTRF